ncbi:alanine racemase [Halobacillus amylolyticus]|uniref:Alanine racemase n=1 Tax=Halobacillus amylolyticus TaxID=2932259 RepID=A0ABY4H722_9BACI|nr:alanine racemase [Halobacillus amylolyticus]UOR10321.1 alanine racemase [Halobacillus amylolyticus]
MEAFYRDTWAEIDLSAIEYNIAQMQKQLPRHTGIYAVVKADAYGHGDVQVARQALHAGAKRLAVSLLDEAIKLRDAGITAPILVMGWTRPEDLPVACENDIEVTVFQKEWIDQVKETSFNKPLKLHMKWDTGMGRIGIRNIKEMDALLSVIKASPLLELQALFTHFATADEEDLTYYQEQTERFNDMYEHFKRVWPHPVEIHTGNSAASQRFPEHMHHFVRFGISMYGLYPSPVVKKERPIDLRPSFSLKSQLIHVKKVEPNESISYGATYQTEEEEWIGTIPIGYADGWVRKLQGMDVLVDGKRHPIVGRICMDQCMIKLDREYSVGTRVTLIGKQDNEIIHTDELADYLETINYEIPCMISYRVPRMYFINGHIVEVDNTL